MDSKGTPVETSLGLDSTGRLFAELVQEQEVIPSPKWFLDVIQRQWAQPATVPPPSNNDKHQFGPGPDLEGILQLPSVDPPVAALTSPAIVPSDASEGLKSENHKRNRRSARCTRRPHGQLGRPLPRPFSIGPHWCGLNCRLD